ncbi:TIGR02099 family protein [Methylomonas sp. LL1]|uniref:YhdP family protein n=1 Tax=Methylomonas sp. LL1 TaxID=2785785 RepID=UPI0018C3D137|nr:YhdP family protein [Methylomonas sp. LL1]QPK62215.1 TIGR02099 family protein [Methylomonas sp. LL1]
MIHHLTRATRHLLFWSLIAAAILLSVVRIFLADIEDYQAALEQKIRLTTDLPIRIGTMEAGMRGFNPEVILRGISIEAADPRNKPDIQLREIRLGIDFMDLLLTRDLLSSSRVTLVGAKVSLIRNLDGSLIVKGLQASDEQPLWLLRGGKYEILDSEITWQDLKRHGEAVHFDRFDLVLKNHYFDKSHEVHLTSKLPRHYGDSLRISALLKGNIFEGKDIEGQLYIEGSDLQAGPLITGDLPLGLNLQSGAGDIRLWSFWRNSSPYQVAGYIQAQQLKISKNQGKPLAMDTFEASFTWSDNDGRWRLAGYDVNIFANHQRWPDGAFYLQLDAQENLSAVIKQLDLPAAMLLAPLVMPADNDYSEWLALNPKGRLRDVSVYVDKGFQQYAASGKFDQLGNQQFEAMPKLQNLSGQFSVTHDYGQIILDSQNAQFDAPNWFRNAIDIKRLHGTLHWWQTADAWQFFSQGLAADSADFATVSNLNLLLPKSDASPVLDLRTKFGQFNDISQAPKYLPAKIMDEGAVDWLDHAFIFGQVNQGELVVNGALDQFPFANGPGRFETVFVIENGELQFNEEWPHLRDLYADVRFWGEDLQVAIAEGGSEKVEIDQALVTIPALADSEHVYVWGQVHSKIMNSLAFLQKSPLRQKIDPIAKLINSEGDARVDLDLKIPYAETEPVKVNVDAHLNGAQLTVKPINLRVDGIKGILNFTEERIGSTRIDARTLGYPVQGHLSSDDQATYLAIEGITSVEMLEKQFALLHHDSVNGAFSYNARLTLPYQTQLPGLLSITTGLKGVSIEGLTGLTKSPNEEKPLSLDFQFDDTAKLPLELHYSDQLQALFLIDKNRDTLHSAHIVFGPGQAYRFEPVGLKLDVRQPVFNLSQALAAFSASDKAKQLEAREVNIDTDQLIWQGRELGAFQSRLRHLNQSWQGSIDSAMAKGRFIIPDQLGGNNRINLDMDFLNLSAMDKFSLEAADEVVTDLPLIDIQSKQLWWRSVELGALKLQTERLINGIHFKKVQLHGPKSKIDLTADWLKQLTGTTTQIKGKLQADDFGEFLSQLGFTDDIKETTADISFKGDWRGGPHQFGLDRLNGQLQIDLKDGRISSIEPGFGRLLGLIAMEQWVKRLSLDFSDVYRQGLAFDQIKGRYKIKDGMAFTDDLTVDAVAATFNLAGFVNLADKTLDQRVAVVPKSSGAVPIAGTIVGGIASIITQVVTDDYKEGYFFGSQYQLSGAWGNVQVTPLHDEDGLLNKTWRGLTDFGWLTD